MTPAPRENGCEELRREIKALPTAESVPHGPLMVARFAVLAIVDRLAAARGRAANVAGAQPPCCGMADGRCGTRGFARGVIAVRAVCPSRHRASRRTRGDDVTRDDDRYPGWSLTDDGYLDEPPPPEPAPRRFGCSVAVITLILALSGVPGVVAGEPESQVGTAIYTASATWCAPTPDKCTDWGGNARLAAVNSFTWGDEPYPVRVWRGEMYVDVTVVSHCGCFGKDGYIDLSPAAFEVLAPLGIGRIDVEVEVLTDLAPHPDDDRMRDEVRDVLPATDAL